MNSIPETPRKKHWKVPTAVGAGALIIGFGMGSTGQPEPEIVTETETETVTVVEEVEVETVVEVVPESCLKAIEAGDEAMDLLLLALDYSADALLASSEFNAAEIDAAAANIEEITPDMGDAAFDWGFWSGACEDSN